MNERGVAAGASGYGLRLGNPGIRSVGPLAFGPEGILFVADNVSRTISAIDIADAGVAEETLPLDVDQLDTRLAAYLGCTRENVLIRDMAAHPASHNVYLSVMRGRGEAAVPVLIRIGTDGTLADVPLEQVPFSQTAIENGPPADSERTEWRMIQGNREGAMYERRDGPALRVTQDPVGTLTVTDLKYVDGLLLVAGASNEEFSSTLRRIPFPFEGSVASTSLEIYHVSHGRFETASPIITFVPVRNNADIVAGYMCTPVVHFSMKDLTPGTHVKGRTVAELGSWNSPIDMVSYTRDGEEYVLVSNAVLPLVKIACKDIGQQEPLITGKEPSGTPRQTMPQQGVGQMANLNGSYIVMIEQDDDGNARLRSYSTATL